MEKEKRKEKRGEGGKGKEKKDRTLGRNSRRNGACNFSQNLKILDRWRTEIRTEDDIDRFVRSQEKKSRREGVANHVSIIYDSHFYQPLSVEQKRVLEHDWKEKGN